MSIGKAFDHLNTIAEITNNVAVALQTHTAARTAIRDYVITSEEKHFKDTEEFNKEAIEILRDIDQQMEPGGPLDFVKTYIASLQEWLKVAREVHHSFSDYRSLVQNKVTLIFSNLAQTARSILQTNTSTTASIVLDVQIANVAVVSYFINGEDHFINNFEKSFLSAKTKLEELIKTNDKDNADTKLFLEMLKSYGERFHNSVDSRKKAYVLFNEKLAPLGEQICDDLKDYQNRLLDIQEGINDLKLLNDYRRKTKNSPLQ